MKWRFNARYRSFVGKVGPYQPPNGERDPNSDILVVYDPVDEGGTPYPSPLITAKRFLRPLPDGYAIVERGGVIAEYADPGYIPCSWFNPWFYGRIVDSYSVPTDYQFAVGYILEILDIPCGRPLPGTPMVGEFAVVFPEYMVKETRETAFVPFNSYWSGSTWITGVFHAKATPV